MNEDPQKSFLNSTLNASNYNTNVLDSRNNANSYNKNGSRNGQQQTVVHH